MSCYIIQTTDKDLIESALTKALTLLEGIEEAVTDKATTIDRAGLDCSVVELIEDALDSCKTLDRQAPVREITTRTSFLLLDSLNDVREWADGRKTEPPVGLAYDVEQLEGIVRSLTPET
jgi:hypothetical protein